MKARHPKGIPGQPLALALIASLLASGCFDSETRLVGPSGGEGDAGADGGDAGPQGPYPDEACQLDVVPDDLSGWEGDPTRWSAAEGSILVAGDDVAGRDRALLLRGATETCANFVARVSFRYTPEAYPLLLGRVTADGRWYGVGYDGFYGVFTATNGLGVELKDRIGELDPVDLTPGETYRMEMRVVDNALLGLLYDETGDRPLALVQGPAGDFEGAGRIGLYEAAGVGMAFGALEAEPLVRGDDAPPHLSTAKLIGPQQLLVSFDPAQAVPLDAPTWDGFSLKVNGQPREIAGIRVRPGTRSEVLLDLADLVSGNDEVQLGYDPLRGTLQDAAQRKVTRFDDAAVENLLHRDAKFEAWVDAFDGDGLGRTWETRQPEAFTVSGGMVRVTPTDAFATGAMLRRPIAERHHDARIAADFRYDLQPDRGHGRTEAVVALRARSFSLAQYQAAMSVTSADARLVLRAVQEGQTTEIAAAPLTRAAVGPGVPLHLLFQARGPVLSASLSTADGTFLGSVAARDTRLLKPGPAGVTGQWNGTVRFDRVEVGPATDTPPFISEARVRAETPGQVDLTVLASSPLRPGDGTGFTVWAGDRREVTSVRRTSEGLALILSSPPIQGGQRVIVRYDPTRGEVLDSGDPPLPLAGVLALEAINEAAPGAELAPARVHAVTPHTLDLLTTDNAALPIHAEGPVARALTVRRNGEEVPVLSAYALGRPHDNVLRLTVQPDLAPTDEITVGYASGGDGRVLDSQGAELRGFLEAPAVWMVPAWPPVEAFRDDFQRPDAAGGIGNGWAPATSGLWSIRDGVLVFQSAGVESLDPRASRPGPAPPRFDVSATVWSSDFDPLRTQPLASVYGGLTRDDPRRPQALSATFNFASQQLTVSDREGALTYGPAVPPDKAVAAGDRVRLRLRVHGRAVQAELTGDAGERLSSVQMFLREEPPAGELGIAGSAGARVLYFDDVRVDAPPDPAPNMLVTDARVTPESANAITFLVQTAQGATGEMLTGGGPGGFTVEVDAVRRNPLRVEPVGSGLRVYFDGPPVARRQHVTLAYDDRLGDVHDASIPISRPLDAFGPVDVDNGADVGEDLFITRAETVGPWAVDLVMNAQAPLPARAEPGAADAFTVRADGVPVPVRAVLPFLAAPDRVRLVLGGSLQPSSALTLSYAPGVLEGRLLDDRGRELQPGYEVQINNVIEPEAEFEDFSDTFDGIGANVNNGWVAAPPRDWSRNGGDLVVTSEDDGVTGRALRPADEAQEHLEIEATLRTRPGAVGPNAVGLVGRASPGRSYSFTVEPESGELAALTLVRTDEAGVRALGRATLPPLQSERDYRFSARFHGPVLQAQLFEEGAGPVPLVRLLAIDPEPLGPGQMGVAGRTRGQTRFHEVRVRPATGYPARVSATSAAVYTYAPRTVALNVAAAADMGFTDGLGFSVTVDAEPRVVSAVELMRRQVLLHLEGAPLGPGQDIRASFNPAEGYVYDLSPVPQPLGAMNGLAAEVVEAPVLSAVTHVGRNLLALDFLVSPAEGALRIEGRGGIDVEVESPALGPDPVRFGVDELWFDPNGNGTRLLLATTDDFPAGARVRLTTDQREGARVVDARGTPLADFAVAAIGRTAELEAVGDFPELYDHSWDPADAGWGYGGPEGTFTPADGLLVGRGTGAPGLPAMAVVPLAYAARDVSVTVDFVIDGSTDPLGQPGWPFAIVRAYNDGSWLGCYVRNTPHFIPALDAGGNIDGPIDDRSPALVCARRLDFGAPRDFEACRMQFYDDVGDGPEVRYDWAEMREAPHRLIVVVQDRRLRGSLYSLEAEAPRLVAVSEVRDIGDDLGVGLAGLGVWDSGVVRFSDFALEAAQPAHFGPYPPAVEPRGECP